MINFFRFAGATFVAFISLQGLPGAFAAPPKAEAWLVYPKAEEAFQVEIQLPKGQSGIPLNKLSEMTVTVKTPFSSTEAPTVSQLDFDARMPDHNHGMMTKPVVSLSGKNVFKISGVKLHMEGFWELIFNLTTQQGQRHKVVVPLTVSPSAGK